MRKLLRASSASILAAMLLHTPAFAYDTDLSDTAVREAYFLGQRNDDKTRAFFVPYTRHLPMPKKGPNISEVRLLTPLAQVVQISSQTTSGYSAQQARLDYHGRGDTLLLVVHIEFTATYGSIDADHSAKNAAGEKGLTLRTEDFWQDFRYGIKQKEDWIEPRAIHAEVDYGGPEAIGSTGMVGAWVYVEYDSRKVTSDDTQVSVFTPDGQEVQTSFDLEKLH